MKRVSKIDFLKNVHSRKFSSAFEAFLFSAGSTRQLWANVYALEESGRDYGDSDEFRILKRRYAVMSSRLRKDGLLSFDMSITKKGITCVKQFFTKKRNMLPKCLYDIRYTKTPVIIVFDIPESKKLYRAWLREALKTLEFTFLQRSVWIGNTKIPASFLHHLRDLGIAQYVEIIELSGKGTFSHKHMHGQQHL